MTTGVRNPGRSSTLQACYKASERRTDKDGTWLAHRLTLRLYGHGPSTLWRWSRRPGCPAIGEVLERRPFADEEGRTSLYFSQAQLDRIAQAEAGASPGDDANWLAQKEALRRYGLALSTLYVLVREGQVRTRKVGRVNSKGRICKVRVLFCAEDLAGYAAKHSPTYRPSQDAVSVPEAAELLGVSVDSVRASIRSRRFRTVQHAPSGSATGPRLAVWLLRSEVEEAKKKRLTASRLSPHVDELGWRWLPVALVEKEHGLKSYLVNQHAHVSPSCWLLDGRRHFGDPTPPKSEHRSLTWKQIPNVGRPGPFLKVYLEDDCRIIADRLAGRLTPQEGVDRARDIQSRMARGEGPAGVTRKPTVGKADAPGPKNGEAPSNGAAGQAPDVGHATATTKPRWDETTATLFFGELAIRKFRRHPAQNQRELIEAFHREAWAGVIPDPFRDPRKLSLTIYDLNQSLTTKAILFHGDGTGEGVMWAPAQ